MNICKMSSFIKLELPRRTYWTVGTYEVKLLAHAHINYYFWFHNQKKNATFPIYYIATKPNYVEKFYKCTLSAETMFRVFILSCLPSIDTDGLDQPLLPSTASISFLSLEWEGILHREGFFHFTGAAILPLLVKSAVIPPKCQHPW